MQQMKMQQEQLDKEKDRQLEIEVALINAESRNSEAKDNLNLQKMMKDFEIKERELDLKQQALNKEGDLTPNGE